MPKSTDKVIETFTLPEMQLSVYVAEGVKRFTSPDAEQVLAQIKEIEVGKGLISYYDKDKKKHKSFTFCCGDRFEYSFVPKEYQVKGTEIDCCGLPVTYDDTQPNEINAYKKAVKVGSTYAEHYRDMLSEKFGNPSSITPANDGATTVPASS